ncbi:hypothetical protein H6G55_28230 [Leptolyngbya sp. FACHB-161]|uniref:hypothetical protein n=1 Tax=unclassified Leptolyngbya TaxID=2650499 RepID=UPI0016894011|nr:MULTISPECIES: hypothetical protein [unclassified Leptolyngbya]MBD2370956.1 hypothetical protein [Leptolyngbya sp. FACHB-161]MBD2401878.1 hypothetical protein [Leptolyngbya sp. FACHB-239]
MAIREFFKDEIHWRDRTGKLRIIEGLSLPNRLRFLEYRAIAWGIIQASPDLPGSVLYDSNREFRDRANSMLLLAGVDPEWCNWELLEGLLFRHEGNDGLIVQMEFPATDPEAKIVEDPSNQYHRAIAALMLLEMDFAKAKQTVDSTPWNELQGVLEQFSAMRSGKPKQAEIKDEDVLKAWGMTRPTEQQAEPITSFEVMGFQEITI